MGRRREAADSGRIAQVRRRVDEWRRARKKRTRMPEGLWRSAARLAEVYGVHQVSRALRVNYGALKQRVEAGKSRAGNGSGLTFVELGAGPLAPCDCVVEFEDGDGAKMTLRVRGATDFDLAGLAAEFWRQRA